MTTKLILRAVNSPFPSPYNDFTKNRVLSHAELDNDLIYLKGLTIYTGQTSGSTLVLKQLNGGEIPLDLDIYTNSIFNHIVSGQTVEVKEGEEYNVYGDLVIDGRLNNKGRVTIMNGSMILSGTGIFDNQGILNNVDLTTPATNSTNFYHIPFDKTVTIPVDEEYFIYGDLLVEGTLVNRGRLVVINGAISLSGTGSVDNYNDIILQELTTPDTDIYVTGGTYSNPTGTAIFTNRNGDTFSVTGFNTGTTEIFVTGGT